MGDDAVVACYGNTVANYWNAGSPIFYSFPLDVSCYSNKYHIHITSILFVNKRLTYETLFRTQLMALVMFLWKKVTEKFTAILLMTPSLI